MINVGIDILEISRVEKIINRNKFFLNFCFSNKEINQLKKKQFFFSSVAAHFCAKEAFFKCLGKKIETIRELKSISVLNSDSGAPILVLSDKLKDKFENFRFSVSVSHSEKFACAVVISKKE